LRIHPRAGRHFGQRRAQRRDVGGIGAAIHPHVDQRGHGQHLVVAGIRAQPGGQQLVHLSLGHQPRHHHAGAACKAPRGLRLRRALGARLDDLHRHPARKIDRRRIGNVAQRKPVAAATTVSATMMAITQGVGPESRACGTSTPPSPERRQRAPARQPRAARPPEAAARRRGRCGGSALPAMSSGFTARLPAPDRGAGIAQRAGGIVQVPPVEPHDQAAIHLLQQMQIVGGHHHRGAQPVQRLEQAQQLQRHFGVHIAGRLVGHQQFGAADHGAGNRHALLFPPERLAGAAPMRSARPTHSSMSATARAISPSGIPPTRSGSATLSKALICGTSR
jgi:hypothetical protein